MALMTFLTQGVKFSSSSSGGDDLRQDQVVLGCSRDGQSLNEYNQDDKPTPKKVFAWYRVARFTEIARIPDL